MNQQFMNEQATVNMQQAQLTKSLFAKVATLQKELEQLKELVHLYLIQEEIKKLDGE